MGRVGVSIRSLGRGRRTEDRVNVIGGRVGSLSLQRTLSGVAIASLLVVFAILGTRPALAVQAMAPTDWSFYMTTTNSTTAYNLGCNQGSFDASHGNADSQVSLDFFAQKSAANGGSGTTSSGITGVTFSTSQIESDAEQFAYGYWVCTGGDLTSVLRLSITTNNSSIGVATGNSTTTAKAYGAKWAAIVNVVASWTQTHPSTSNPVSQQVDVWGGNDIEPSWGGSSSRALTRAWVDGYAATANVPPYLNIGSADGCPPAGSCNNGWTSADVYYVSWGNPEAWAAPEIYYNRPPGTPINAQQWQKLSLYGYVHYSGTTGAILFEGPLDQHTLKTTSNTSSEAWNQLWTQLNSDSRTAQSLFFSEEVHHET